VREVKRYKPKPQNHNQPNSIFNSTSFESRIHNKVCPTFLKTMREKHVNPSNPQTLFRGFEGRRNPAHLLLGFAVKTLISKHILRRIFWIKPMISFHKIPIQKISTIPMRQTNQPTIRLSRNKRSCFPQTKQT
jgi:hypothetical protein